MDRKISFYNKTIFKKNITLYWPIWGIYTLVLLCSLPGILWLEYNTLRVYGLTSYEKVVRLCNVLESEDFHIWMIAITAVFTGMAVFHYMYNAKSANMIHSLPTNRTELFGTNMLSGLTFLAAPQVLTFVVSVLVCLCAGVTRVEYLALWLLFVLATDIIAFSIVVFCVMFTGQMIALPVYVVIVNSLAFVIGGLMDIMVSIHSYGVDGTSRGIDTIVKWLSPLVCYLDSVGLSTVYTVNGQNQIEGMRLNGIECILIYLVMSIVLYLTAYFIYQKRHIEQAGDLITVKAVKPLFRWGVSVCAGIYGAIFVSLIFELFGRYVDAFSFVLIMVVLGMLFYFLADMLVRKSFHVFERQNWFRAGICCVVVLVSYIALYGYAEYAERKVPKAEDVVSVEVNMDYSLRDQDPEWVTAVHQKIIDNLSYIEDINNQNIYIGKEQETINFSYLLEDGTYMHRYYVVPMDDGIGKEILNTFIEQENNPEQFLKRIFGNDYKSTQAMQYGEVEYAYFKYNADETIDETVFSSAHLEEKEASGLYQAIIADAMAGNLMKYNRVHVCNEHVELYQGEKNIFWISLNGMDKTIYYGSDCTNIINEIIRLGYVKDVDSFCWEDYGYTGEASALSIEDVLCDSYEYVKVFYEGAVDIRKAPGNYISIKLDEIQTETLYWVITKEWIAGNLSQYDPYEQGNVCYISLEYMDPSNEMRTISYFTFGSDCTYIIDELIGIGVITSEEDICWDK